ncbi:MAG: YraN family protein [Acidimicrobiales bacterium]|nr:YraN family protein [Acidimicrobiales bacterium]
MTRASQALGAYGESLAAAWYESHGYEVLDRNWRCREGELDLVVCRNRLIVFCEVKARTTDAYGTPGEAVTYRKRQRIRQLAAKWLETSPIRPREIRFDVATVLGGELEVIEGAF